MIPAFGLLAAFFFLLASRSYEGDKARIAAVRVDADAAAAVHATPAAAR